jgi:hypothetical protein
MSESFSEEDSNIFVPIVELHEDDERGEGDGGGGGGGSSGSDNEDGQSQQGYVL